MPDHDRARRRRLSREPLKAAGSTHPVPRQLADLDRQVGRHRRDSVVVVSLHAHDARRLRRTKAHREDRPEHDRHLPEEVARVTLADDALDPIDQLHRLDESLEHREERTLRARGRRVLPWHEADVSRHSRERLTLGVPQRS